MATNIIKEKEKQQDLLYVFIFLAIFLILFWLFPPSFDFSPPITELETTEKDDYLTIMETLDGIDFEALGDFRLIPAFDGTLGRGNPFSRDITVVIEETTEEEEEEEDEEDEEEEIEEEEE